MEKEFDALVRFERAFQTVMRAIGTSRDEQEAIKELGRFEMAYAAMVAEKHGVSEFDLILDAEKAARREVTA